MVVLPALQQVLRDWARFNRPALLELDARIKVVSTGYAISLLAARPPSRLTSCLAGGISAGPKLHHAARP